MKIISLNIEMDRHHDLVIPFLMRENADVICLQELLESDFEAYKEVLNMEGFYKPIEYVYHEAYGGPRDVRHGEAIFAKKLIDPQFEYYVGSQESINRPFKEYFAEKTLPENRVLISAKVADKDGKELVVCTTHFTLTEMGISSPKQLADLEKLFDVLKKYPKFVLVGDTNAPRGNETWARLANKYKDNIPNEYTTSLDMNLHRKGNFKKFENMVDGLFTTQKYIASNVHLVDGVSDHMAVVADINIEE